MHTAAAGLPARQQRPASSSHLRPLTVPPPPLPPLRRCRSNLNGKSLQGTIPDDPSLWADLPGLTSLDLSNNPGLSGGVPDALGTSAALSSM